MARSKKAEKPAEPVEVTAPVAEECAICATSVGGKAVVAHVVVSINGKDYTEVRLEDGTTQLI